jgi:cysteine desulfurase
MDPRVIETMTRVMAENFGNPSSVTHAFGWKAKAQMEESRSIAADFLSANSTEIIFTSGATEANNLAIFGVAEACAHRSKVIVTVKTEHHATLKAVEQLGKKGFEVHFLSVDSEGRVLMDELDAALKLRPSLVSIMMVNNETGVIQDIPKMAEKIKASGAYFHVDAVQAAGKLPLDMTSTSIDLLSLSAHKIYGPKGVGLLYVRGQPKTPLRPLFFGGGQEQAIRPGTSATHQIAGFAEALKWAKEEYSSQVSHAALLSQALLSRLGVIPHLKINGAQAERIPHILNLQFKGIDAEALVASMGNLAVSMGSACTSGTTQVSHVLSAMGLSDSSANSSIRFSFGRFTTLAEIESASSQVIEAVHALRALSPVWGAS